MRKIKFLSFGIILFLLIQTLNIYSLENRIVISVGNQPITHLDLVKEMKLVAILSNQKIMPSNKEQIKNIAVQTLIKRKIKQIELIKRNVKNYNNNDLERLILKTSNSLGTDKEGLEKIMKLNNLSLNTLADRFKVDLLWNSLIFELYKNKVTLNMSEIEEKINLELVSIKDKRQFLLSEIEINKPVENPKIELDKIMKSIALSGFESTAKKYSISRSAEYGGNIGWIEEKNLSKIIFDNIKNLNTDDVSQPIFLSETIVIIKMNGEKIFKKDIQKIKDRVVRTEKEKKLQMFSNSHYSNLRKISQIEFL